MKTRMMVKRTVKVEMPKLKRCKAEGNDSGGEGESCSASPNKLKTDELFTVPIRELEDYRTSLVDSFCREALSYAGEVESSLVLARASRSLDKALEVSNNKPPLLKSSRGRIQVLPSKFNDSVLPSWRKEENQEEQELLCLNEKDEEAVLPRKKRFKLERSNVDMHFFKNQLIHLPSSVKIQDREFSSMQSKDCSRSSVTSIGDGGSSVVVESGECKLRVKRGSVRADNFTKEKLFSLLSNMKNSIALILIFLFITITFTFATTKNDDNNNIPGFGPVGGFNIPGFGPIVGGGYGGGFGGPKGGYGKGGIIRPTIVCKDKGPCFGKKLKCPSKCFKSSSGAGKGYGYGGGGGGCIMDCKKKCLAYC